MCSLYGLKTVFQLDVHRASGSPAWGAAARDGSRLRKATMPGRGVTFMTSSGAIQKAMRCASCKNINFAHYGVSSATNATTNEHAPFPSLASLSRQAQPSRSSGAEVLL